MRCKIIKYVGVAAWQWKGVDEGDICGICQNEFEKTCPSCRIPGKDCPLTFGKCSHKYHSHCIDTWLKNNFTCPMCRTNWQREPTAKERKELAEWEARQRAQALATDGASAESGAPDEMMEDSDDPAFDVNDPALFDRPGSEPDDEDGDAQHHDPDATIDDGLIAHVLQTHEMLQASAQSSEDEDETSESEGLTANSESGTSDNESQTAESDSHLSGNERRTFSDEAESAGQRDLTSSHDLHPASVDYADELMHAATSFPVIHAPSSLLEGYRTTPQPDLAMIDFDDFIEYPEDPQEMELDTD